MSDAVISLIHELADLDLNMRTAKDRLRTALGNGALGNGHDRAEETAVAAPFAAAPPQRGPPAGKPRGARRGTTRKQVLANAEAAQNQIVDLLLANGEAMATTTVVAATQAKKGTAAHRLETLAKLGRLRRAGPGLWEAAAAP